MSPECIGTHISLLNYLFAPGALTALRALKVSGEAEMQRHQYLAVGRHEFMSTILTLVCAYAYLELESVEAGNKKYDTNADNGNQLPYTLGYEECGNEKSGKQCDHAYCHNNLHSCPNRLVFVLDLLTHFEQKLFVFFVNVFHTDFLPT